MKTWVENDTSVNKDVARRQSPAKVCMHVLNPACTDARVMRAAAALVEKGFAVDIIDIEYERKQPVEEDIRGIHIKHIVMPNWRTSGRLKLWFLIQVAHLLMQSIVQLIRSSADLYHAHETTALPACFLAARLRRKPLIFDAHELPLSDEVHSRRWRGLITLFSCLLTIMVPRCAGVITVSAPIAQEIRRRYRTPDVSLIRNIPPYCPVSRSQRLRQHLGLSQEVRIALYQGGFDVNRGLDRLIRASAFLKPGNLIVLMGPDRGGLCSQLESLISSEGVTDRVKILPAVSYGELMNWTASADIGLIVYTPEYSQNVQMCLPNKLFEYLMAGLPILASPLDAVSDLIKRYDVGQVVSSLRPLDIGEAINAMLADSAALVQMRCNALEAVQHALCWEKESEQLVHLYYEILKNVQGGKS